MTLAFAFLIAPCAKLLRSPHVFWWGLFYNCYAEQPCRMCGAFISEEFACCSDVLDVIDECCVTSQVSAYSVCTMHAERLASRQGPTHLDVFL